jgi:MFS family permease
VSEAGLLMIPVMLTSSLTSNTAGRYSQRTGFYKRPLMIGLPISIAALLPLALLANWLPPWGSAVLLMVVGWGIGPCFPCSTVAVQNAVERRDLGTVSGALAFARVLGAAIIVAAASALVLGLIAQALPDAGATTSLEDLARRELPAAARDAVAHAFGVTYGVLALGLVASFAVFATVEDRRLREQVGPSGAPTADRSS